MKEIVASEMNQSQPQIYHPLIDKLRDDCLNRGESGIKGNLFYSFVSFNFRLAIMLICFFFILKGSEDLNLNLNYAI